MTEIIKRYENDEITVVWQPSKCTHSKKCAHGLPKVFDPTRRPWVQLSAADNEQIIAQVRNCPSNALSLEGDTLANNTSRVKVTVSKGGPLLIKGKIEMTLPDGTNMNKEGITALCRCGASANKPYCDGSHNKINFDA